MDRIVIALAIIAVVAVVAVVARSWRTPDAPTQRSVAIPDQLDRSDFDRPETPWLVAVFSSATCDVCRSVIDKARVLECADVAVVEVEYLSSRSLHERYAISAVPTLVVADAQGVSHAGFVGPMSATDLWAAVAEARQPGTTPEPDLGRATP